MQTVQTILFSLSFDTRKLFGFDGLEFSSHNRKLHCLLLTVKKRKNHNRAPTKILLVYRVFVKTQVFFLLTQCLC